MAPLEKLDFEEFREAMNQVVEEPGKITEFFLGMPRDNYEAVKK
jgi:hypothetical protein